MPRESIVVNIGGNASKLRYDTLDGKKYLVAPAAILVEGVWKGSQGDLYYPASELGKTPVVWNMKPVVVYHPEDNGKPISASNREVIESRQVGMMLNSLYDDKLRTELWLDEAKTEKVDPRVLPALKKGDVLEVSTGLFTDNEHHEEREYNGTKYSMTAKNYRTDHLAILPDKKGACSSDDGAGILANQEKKNMVTKNELLTEHFDKPVLVNRDWSEEKRMTHPAEDFGDPDNRSYPVETQEDLQNAASLLHHAGNPNKVKKRLKSIAKRKGLKVPSTWSDPETGQQIGNAEHSQACANMRHALQTVAELQTVVDNKGQVLTTNMISHQETRSAIETAMLDQYGTQDGYWPGWIEDVYEDGFVYKQEGKYYKGAYSYDAGKNHVTVDDKTKHMEVSKRTNYIDKEGKTVHETPTGTTSSVGKDGSVGGSQVKQPSALIPGTGKHELGSNAAVGTSDIRNQEGKTMTTQEYINQAPPEIQVVLNQGLQTLNQRRTHLYGIIKNAKGNSYTDEQLAAKTVDDLQVLANIIVANTQSDLVSPPRPAPNYSGAAGYVPPVANDAPKVPVLTLPQMTFNEEKIDTTKAFNKGSHKK